MDLYQFDSIADLGVGFYKTLRQDYRASVLIVNGEGYKASKSESDSLYT